MIGQDKVGMVITPSRRTGAAQIAILRRILEPMGAYIWDMSGENPYFGFLAVADAIVVTMDSISMVSEAVATSAPVLVQSLPGKSRRIGLFAQMLEREQRVRPFAAKWESWAVAPLDDTDWAAAEMLRRLGETG
jgi:mitochondrial fission protein ELM1